ncbi:MAG: hypothetical protein A2V66_05765 [Ignavibacteria bacterium RBG_13_36_8]|nr:MAG: hypothetical protein A2V66_05765 [Ignavibacteria bacterium RBG_13_36_8]
MQLTRKLSLTEYIRYIITVSNIKENLLVKEIILILFYLLAFIICLFIFPDLEYVQWITLVIVPFTLLFFLQRKNLLTPSFKLSLALFGLKRNNISNGIIGSMLLGLVICIIQYVFIFRNIVTFNILESLQVFLILPIAFLLLIFLGAFTEEFFFRGIIQTRIVRIIRSKTIGVVFTALLYAVFRIVPHPFTLEPSILPFFDSQILSSFLEGLTIGILLGHVYVKSDENLISAVLLNAFIYLLPTMLFIQSNWF